MLLLHKQGCLALVQRCVDYYHETIGALDLTQFGGAGGELILLASQRWLVYSDPAKPILATTHHHRHIRGIDPVTGFSIASSTAAYTPEFAALFA